MREVALLALGSMPVKVPNPHPAYLAIKRLSLRQEIQEHRPLALAVAIGRQRVAVGDQLVKLYRAHQPPSPAQKANQAGDALSVRQAAIWSLGELRDPKYLEILDQALRDHELSVRCLSAIAFEKVVAFESSPYLQRAFEASNRDQRCPQVVAPTQEGVKALVLMEKSYQLALMKRSRPQMILLFSSGWK